MATATTIFQNLSPYQPNVQGCFSYTYAPPPVPNNFGFQYLVVVDFEATCEKEAPEDFVHEIIQFPAVLINVQKREVVSEFNRYCRPTLFPKISEFCTSLTGITQDLIDEAQTFPKVLKEFQRWLSSYGLGKKYSYSIVTDGHCDMGKFLYQQCLISGINYPTFAFQWIDIRLTYSELFKLKWHRLSITMEFLQLKFSGKLHNGLDDSRNIGKVLIYMMECGASPLQNERIVLDLYEQELNPLSHKYALRTVKYIHLFNQVKAFIDFTKSTKFVHSYSKNKRRNKENLVGESKKGNKLKMGSSKNKNNKNEPNFSSTTPSSETGPVILVN